MIDRAIDRAIDMAWRAGWFIVCACLHRPAHRSPIVKPPPPPKGPT